MLKLEEGKTYKTRGGDIVVIDGRSWAMSGWFSGYHADNYRSWREDGVWTPFGREHDLDLVEEVPHGTVDDLTAARQHSVALSCIMTAVEAAHG